MLIYLIGIFICIIFIYLIEFKIYKNKKIDMTYSDLIIWSIISLFSWLGLLFVGVGCLMDFYHKYKDKKIFK